MGVHSAVQGVTIEKRHLSAEQMVGRQASAQLLPLQVCGTTAPDLDSYRQHVRAKQHMRRVQNRHSAHM